LAHEVSIELVAAFAEKLRGLRWGERGHVWWTCVRVTVLL